MGKDFSCFHTRSKWGHQSPLVVFDGSARLSTDEEIVDVSVARETSQEQGCPATLVAPLGLGGNLVHQNFYSLLMTQKKKK